MHTRLIPSIPFHRLLLGGLLALVSAAPASAARNLVVNGGFEQDMADGEIPGWTACEDMQRQRVWLEEEEVRHGRRSLAVRILESGTPGERHGRRATLSQRIPVEPGNRYVFSLWYLRESALFGAFVHIQLIDENGGEIPEGLYRQNLRSGFWTSTQLSFDSGTAHWADIRIINNTAGTWRISVGRNLWVDEVSLVRIGEDGNRQEIDVDADGRGAAGVLDLSAPSRLFPWVALRAEGPHTLVLEMDGHRHRFRTYTWGEDTWVQPLLPDLVVSGGRHPVRLTAEGEGVAIRRVLFAQSPTWQPDGAPDFLPAAEAAERAAGPAGAEPGIMDVPLRMDGALPPGRWPVAQGVPFPRGLLYDAARVAVRDARSGSHVAAQTDALMRWPDGSIRWLSVALHGEANQAFVLRANDPDMARPAPAEPVRVVETEDALHIHTGPLHAVVPRDGSRLLGPVSVGEQSLIEAAHLSVNGAYTSAGVPPRIEVEEAGPVRAVVRLSGTHRSASGGTLLDYELRWFFHAGSARVDVEHTFLHRDAAVEITLDRVDLAFDLAEGAAERFRTGGDGSVDADLRAAPVLLGSRLVEDPESTRATYPFRIEQAGEALAQGFRHPGAFAIEGSRGAVAIRIRDFWQNGPRAIEVARARLVLGLVGHPGSPFYTGMSKTSRLTLALDGNPAAADAFAADALLLAEPAWYAQTRATGHLFHPRSEGRYPAYERCMEISFRRWPASTEASLSRTSGAGLLHYGDTVGSRGDGNNLETALDEGSLIQFLRTGDRDVYDYARIAIDHFVDIDIDHSHRNGGLIWVHRSHSRDVADAGRAGVNGHSWFNGVVHFEMFRASRRIHDIADRVGRYYTRHGFDLEPYVRPWRPLAWQVMSLVQAYEVTGRTEYLHAARQSLRVTRHQRDFLIEEWPYMFGVGLKAVRHYYEASADPAARELFLQLLDGFLRLRDRPEDTLNGEWRKPEGTLLGNFPNDRSCAFYNEAAWAWRYTGRRAFVDRAAFDLNWHTAFDVNDPTLLWGSADLVQVMSELGIGPVEASVEHPWVFMLPEQPPVNGEEEPEAGVAVFHIESAEDRDFTVSLLKSAIFKYMIDHDGYAEVTAPSGRVAGRIPITNRGIGLYTIPVPADGETGIYTLRVVFEDLWRWTMEETILRLEPGLNHIELDTRSGWMALDAFTVAPRGRFPWFDEDLPHLRILQAESLERPDAWELFRHPGAMGGAYLRRTGGRTALRVPVRVDEAGEYRFFARVWYPYNDVLEVRVEGADGDARITGQVHDMARNAFPMLSVTSSLGPDAVHRYWGNPIRQNPPMALYSSLYMGAGKALMPWLDTWSVSATDPRRVAIRPAAPEAGLGADMPVRVRIRSGNRNTDIGRDYRDTPGIDLSQPHAVTFRWRPDDLSAFRAHDLTWIRFFLSGAPGRAGGDVRWWAGALPRADDGAFRLWFGDRQGRTTSGSVDTGIRPVEGRTYTFRVEVYPDGRYCRLRLEDGEQVFVSPELPWRTASTEAGGALTLNMQNTAADGSELAYTLLSFSVEPITPEAGEQP